MITEEELDKWRMEGTKVRVVRDDDPRNDIRGIVLAWDDDVVLIRKPNRKVVKLDRHYRYEPVIR